MGQLKNEIQERRRVLNLFLINVKSKRSNKDRRTHWHRQRELKEKAEEGASAAGGVASTHCVGCYPRWPGKPLEEIKKISDFMFFK
jgi:hypothetical protein